MSLREAVNDLARAAGFDRARIAPATPLAGAAAAMRSRLADGHLDGMPWIDEARVARATDPATLLPGARSFVAMAVSYWDDVPRPPAVPGHPRGRVARYAWGRDYHDVLRAAAMDVASGLAGLAGRAIRSRVFVDSSPLAERAVAINAGVGWGGKSTMVLVPGMGSYVLLATILTDLEIEPDRPLAKSCGACVRCIDACPTGAIVAPGVLDSRACISFHTIENRGAIPPHLRPAIGDWVFGCDDCQEPCPVNRRPARGRLAALRATSLDDAWPALLPILAMDDAAFAGRYRGTAVSRTKRRGLQRNACVVLGNLRDPATVPALVTVATSPATDRVVRGHAAWALGRIGGAPARDTLRLLAASDSVIADPDLAAEVASALEAAD